MNTTTPTLDALLEHRSWVHALARQLVRDPDAAADLEQETWLEAVRQPPGDVRNPKGWLATVLRNKARGTGRAASRRQRHESAHSPAAPASSAAQVAEHAEAQARLSQTVLRMAEPYRSVLLLRYFDDQSPQTIAKTLGRPVATVGTQITRGLAILRRELDSEYGDRKAWLVAIGPLAGYGAPAPAAAGGVMGLAAAALLLTGLGTWALGFWSTETTPSPLDADISPEPGSPVAAASPAPERQTPTRVSAGEDLPSLAQSVRPLFAGELRTLDGESLAGMTIEFDDPKHPVRDGHRITMGRFRLSLHPSTLERYRDAATVRRLHPNCPNPKAVAQLVQGKTIPLPRVVTDARGKFRIRGPKSSERLRLTDPNHMILGMRKMEDGRNVVLVARRHALRGRVFDPLGRPVAGAKVSVSADATALINWAKVPTTYSEMSTLEQSTAEDGSFTLPDLPHHRAVSVLVEKPGYQTRRLPTIAIRRVSVRWTLIEDPKWNRRVSGRVLRADGTPAVDAIIALGHLEHAVDASGNFDFTAHADAFGEPLIAVERGSQPATIRGLAARVKRNKAAAKNLVLHLGAAPRTVRGQIVDGEGVPLVGMQVLVLDATLVGRTVFQTVETLMAMPKRPPMLTPDAKGRFEVQLRSDRTYRLRAFDSKSLLVIDGVVSQSATEVRLQAPTAPFFAEVTGRLVNSHGLPLPNVALTITGEVLQRRDVQVGLNSKVRIETDEAGRFRFRDVPKKGVRISILSPLFEDLHHSVTGRQLTISAQPLHRFRLEIHESRNVDSFEIHGPAAERLGVRTLDQPGQLYKLVSLSDVDLSKQVLLVSETAHQIVFFQGQKEVSRKQISLRPGIVQTLRY